MRGVLNVNKPGGITSYDVIRRIKREYPGSGIRDPGSGIGDRPGLLTPDPRPPRIRIGHAGTLDRMARGVLLVLLGEATKIADFLQGLEKEYVAVVQLGVRTDTDDSTGRVLEERPIAGVDLARIQALLPEFTGEIEQVPPVYSALKLAGVRASDRARRGEPVAPKPRRITVREIEASDFQAPIFKLRVVVSRGTYVRSLARDLGGRLGCGATLEALTRIRIGSFRIQDAVDPDAFDPIRIPEQLIAITDALSFLPGARVGPGAARELRAGRALGQDEVLHWRPGTGLPELGNSLDAPPGTERTPPAGPVCISDEAGSLLVIARHEDGMWRTLRGIYADY